MIAHYGKFTSSKYLFVYCQSLRNGIWTSGIFKKPKLFSSVLFVFCFSLFSFIQVFCWFTHASIMHQRQFLKWESFPVLVEKWSEFKANHRTRTFMSVQVVWKMLYFKFILMYVVNSVRVLCKCLQCSEAVIWCTSFRSIVLLRSIKGHLHPWRDTDGSTAPKLPQLLIYPQSIWRPPLHPSSRCAAQLLEVGNQRVKEIIPARTGFQTN